MLSGCFSLISGQPNPDHFKTHTNSIDSAEMVYIFPGEFVMGSDSSEIDQIWKRFSWNNDEKKFTMGEQPAHHVRLNGFWIYRTLVTVSQYRRFCIATKHKMPESPSYGWKDSNPIVNVSWYDASAYCT